MQRFTIAVFFLLIGSIANAQGAWYPKANFGGAGRWAGHAFSIGSNGYFGTGSAISGTKNDHWRYTPSTNTWTQMANAGGGARTLSISFAVNNKGYVGLGGGKTDLWEYNETSNTWTQKANFPAGGRLGAVAFGIGNYGYVGTGSNGTTVFNDFWQYDPSTNAWSQKTNFGGAARFRAAAFAVGGYGYIGTGWDNGSTEFKDLWQYNPATNAWVQKANFGGTGRDAATGFTINNYGYIGLGVTASGFVKDLWQYNPANDTWTQKQNFPGAAREFAMAFSIGSIAYVGCGYITTPATAYQDFYAFDLCNGFNATYTATATSCYPCTDGTVDVTPSGGFNGYAYQWSTGSTLQDATGLLSGTYTVVVSDSFQCSKTLKPFVPLPTCTVNITGTASTISSCTGPSVSLTGTYLPAGNISYTWSPATALSNTNTSNPIATPTSPTTYRLIAQDVTTQCPDTAYYTITALPALTFNTINPICKGQTIGLSATGGVVAYAWSTGQSTSAISVTPSVTTTYTLTASDAGGCSVTGTKTVVVNCQGNSVCSNQDFETGTFGGWNGLLGTNSSTTVAATLNMSGGFNFQGNNISPLIGSQHTILTTNTLDSLTIDSITNQPDVSMTKLAPGGGNYSVRLGNRWTGCGAEGLRFPFTPSVNDSMFSFQFACVFQNAGHSRHMNPGFMYNVYDGSNAIVPSMCDTIQTPDPGYQFLHVSPSAPDPTVLYKRWSTVSLDLSAYIGQTVNVELVNFDCGECGHWGYSYVDVSCNSFLAVSSSYTEPNCNKQCNGTATVNVAGGSTPYTYLWSNTQTTQTATGLCASSYSVSISDAMGTTSSAVIALSEPAALSSVIAITNASSCSASDGSITAAISGGTTPYTFQWNPSGQTSATATGLPVDTFIVTVTDAHGCIFPDTAAVSCPSGMTQTYSLNNVYVYPNPAGEILTVACKEKKYEVTATNLFGKIIFNDIITAPSVDISFTEHKNGIYFLQVKTENGIVTKKIIIQK